MLRTLTLAAIVLTVAASNVFGQSEPPLSNPELAPAIALLHDGDSKKALDLLKQAVSDGTVKHILIVEALPGGLTERCIAAAKKIKFIPATRDGLPVSMWMQLDYNFNLY